MKSLTFLHERKTPIIHLPFPESVVDNDKITLRKRQINCFSNVVNEKNAIIAACPSFGKSIVGRADFLYNHRRKKFKRFVWLSPTRQLIGEQSEIKNIEMPDGSGILEWKSVHSTHQINDIDGIIEYIKKWFETDKSWDVFSDCLLITTRAAFVLFCDKYSHLVKDCLIALDEAQFILTDDEIEKNGNRIGDSIGHLIDNQDTNNVGIRLYSGTMIRGDMCPNLHEKYYTKFKRYDVPLSDYMEDCHYLKSIGWTTLTYDKTPESILMKEMKDFKPFIGWIGRANTDVCNSPELKPRNVRWFIKAVAQSNKPKYTYDVPVEYDGKEYPVLRVLRGTQEYILLDLVQNNRDLKYEYILLAHKGKVKLDGVIALELLKIGTNFGPAAKAFYLGYIPHSGEGVQIGRASCRER